MREPAVDEHELDGEQQAGDEPGKQACHRAPKRRSCRAGAPRRAAAAVATIERSAACATSETSAAIHLIVTCWNPHSAVSSSITASAVASSAGVLAHRWILAYHDSCRGKQRCDFERNIDPMARAEEESVSRDETGAGRVLERPDGFYWQAKAASCAARSPRAPKPRPTCLAGGAADGEFDPEPRRCRKPSPSSASPSGSIPTPAVRPRTTSRASKTTEENRGQSPISESCASLEIGLSADFALTPNYFATSTSRSLSAPGSTGLVRWWSKPASIARRRSSSWPQPVSAMSVTPSPRRFADGARHLVAVRARHADVEQRDVGRKAPSSSIAARAVVGDVAPRGREREHARSESAASRLSSATSTRTPAIGAVRLRLRRGLRFRQRIGVRQRQAHDELAALARAARCGPRPLPPCSSTSRCTSDRPMPRPPCERSFERVDLRERLEQALGDLGPDADAVVLHADHDLVAGPLPPRARSRRRRSVYLRRC